MKLKQQLRQKLSLFHCPVTESNQYNWSFILYTVAEFVNLRGNCRANGLPGDAVPDIGDPGAFAGNTYAATENHKTAKLLFENYKMVKSETRETIVWAFQHDYLLDQRDEMGSLFFPPLELLDYIWSTFATQDQRDNEVVLAQADQRTA